MNPVQPPRWVDSLLNKLTPTDLVEEIKGDLYETFLSDVKSVGSKKAKRNYTVRALGFLTKRFFWKKSTQYQNTSTMLGSYFKIARRSLLAYKSTAAINILGLVIGIAAALVILIVVRYELSFDTFHSKADRIYRVVRVSGSDMSEFRTGVSYPVVDAMRDEIPSLEQATAMEYQGGILVDIAEANGETRMFREDQGVSLVDSTFFQVFDFAKTSFHWIAGTQRTALNAPFSVVLTQSLAKKYFGTEQALGKTLKLEKRVECQVTGVIEDLPANTDLPFTMLVSYSTLRKIAGNQIHDWNSVNDDHHVYVVLTPVTTQQEMEHLIAKVHAAHTPKELHENRHYLLQPLKKVHMEAKFGNYNGRTISRETVLALSVIGIFLLLTAAINYINLATAQSSLRAKEIGLRKVMGSNRQNLMAQFLAETFVLVFIAGIVALGVAELVLINFQSLLNIKWTTFNFTDPTVLLSWFVILVTVSLFAGLYPSLTIARFNPVTALKSRFSTESFGGFSLRKVLVVAQFTITQILVVGTFMVVSQMDFFMTTDMGFNRESIITARVGNNSPEKLQVLENQLRAQSFIENVSFSYTLPSGLHRNRSFRDIGRPEATASKDFQIYEYAAISPTYLDLFGIKLIAGRNLTTQDTTGNILINEKLMRNLGWTNPEAAVGQELKDYGQKFKVVGVVGNFMSNSLKEGVDNIMMIYNPQALWTASMKLQVPEGQSMTEAVAEIEKIWKANFPDYIPTWRFFDENIAAFYQQEKKYSQLFQLFSLVFLLIGCLGLYGLITFVVNRKGKEVAIRKVLGANVSNILVLFSREYVHLILISFVIAVPVAWYGVNSWLSNFANHIELTWWRFLLPGLLVLGIALLVVTSKSLRTANANPVEKLKEE